MTRTGCLVWWAGTYLLMLSVAALGNMLCTEKYLDVLMVSGFIFGHCAHTCLEIG